MTTDTPTDDSTETEQRDRAQAAASRDEGAESRRDEPSHSPSLNPLQVISSVLAAGLGVQSSRNRERDFKQGRAGTFILAGLVFTALFIGGVYTVVSLVLAGR